MNRLMERSARSLFEGSSRRILVAHDFSKFSDLALDYAMDLAVRERAKIRLIHIVEPEPMAYAQVSPRLDDRLHARQFDGEQRLQAAADRCSQQAIDTEQCIRTGSVAEVLEREVNGWGPQLLFLGAFGAHGTAGPCLGSTTEFLLRSLPCTVVAVGPKTQQITVAGGASRTMICPLDLPGHLGGASDIEEQLKMIVNYARTLHATVKLIHVVDVSHELSRPHSAADTQFEFELLVGRLLCAGVAAEATLLYGRAETVIPRYALEQHACCILFGLHQEGAFTSYYYKSLVASVIRQATCPTWAFAQKVGAAARKPVRRPTLAVPATLRAASMVQTRDDLSYRYEY